MARILLTDLTPPSSASTAPPTARATPSRGSRLEDVPGWQLRGRHGRDGPDGRLRGGEHPTHAEWLRQGSAGT